MRATLSGMSGSSAGSSTGVRTEASSKAAPRSHENGNFGGPVVPFFLSRV